MRTGLRARVATMVLIMVMATLVTTPARSWADDPGVVVTADVDTVRLAPVPCALGRFVLSLTNTGDKPAYATALVDAGDLEVVPRVVASYLPPGHTFSETVTINPPDVEGEFPITLTAGNSRQDVIVVVDDHDLGDNLARRATATASSSYPGRPACGAIDGNTDSEAWSDGVGWSDATQGVFPDWWAMTFSEPTEISSVTMYTLDSAELPAPEQGLRAWDIQVPDGEDWRTIASVRDNTDGIVTTEFPAVTVTGMRILGLEGNGDYSRIVELEAYA